MLPTNCRAIFNVALRPTTACQLSLFHPVDTFTPPIVMWQEREFTKFPLLPTPLLATPFRFNPEHVDLPFQTPFVRVVRQNSLVPGLIPFQLTHLG